MTPVNGEVVSSDPKVCTSDSLQLLYALHCCSWKPPFVACYTEHQVEFLYKYAYMFHTRFLILNQKKIYLTQFTYWSCKLFQVRLDFSGFAHGFLGITVIKVNHSIQKGKILIKRRKALGLNRLKISLDLLHHIKWGLQKWIPMLEILSLR